MAQERTPKGGYAQDWPAYNLAQGNEKRHFLSITGELCKEAEEFGPSTGLTPFPLKEVLLCQIYRIYLGRSSRRTTDDLRELQARGLIGGTPAPNTLTDYMRQEFLTPILQHLLTKSSLPLASRERAFAADSTSFSLPHRRPWYNRHKERWEKRRDFAKLHVMTGVVSNIITCAIPSAGTEHDGGYLKQLLQTTSRYFEVAELSADAAYLSGENMRLALIAGAVPYIAFRKDCRTDADYKSNFWKDLLYLYKTRHPQFDEHYFLRSNVEATFSSLKAKFGGRLRGKTARAQFNEMLCKAVCHNVCVLIHSMYESGINPTSWGEVEPRPTLAPGVALKAREQEMVAIKIAAAGRTLPTQEAPPKRRSRRARARKGKLPAVEQISLFE